MTPYLDTLSVANPFVVEPEPSGWDLAECRNRTSRAFTEYCRSERCSLNHRTELMDEYKHFRERFHYLRGVQMTYRNRSGYDLGGDCE